MRAWFLSFENKLAWILLALVLLTGVTQASASHDANPTNLEEEVVTAGAETQDLLAKAPNSRNELIDRVTDTRNWVEGINQTALEGEIDALVIDGIDFSEILADSEAEQAANTRGLIEATLEDLLTDADEEVVDEDVASLLAEVEEPPSLLTPDEAEDVDLNRPIAEEKYLLQIGDRLLLSIYGEPGTSREVVVDSTGSISYLLVGRVVAIGKTIDQLRRELDQKIKDTFKYAFVTVTPVEFGGQYFTILGEVVKPGKKILSGRMTLLSALCDAGGFRTGHFRNQTIELADLEHAFLAREGDYVPVDFDRLVMEGDLTQDVVLRPDDYVYIPNSLYKEIHILGEVNIPTTIGFLNTVSLSEAICQARGVTPRSSSRVFVIRGALSNPIRIEADLNRILKGLEKDVLLQPGDIVYVPVRRFENFREVVRAGIRAFVGAAANEGGNRSFIYVHPHARGEAGTVNTVQVIQ